jgi:predicted outer membrane protein
MKNNRILTVAALIASTLTLPLTQAADKPAAKDDIVAVASSAGSFKTLVTAPPIQSSEAEG